MTSRGSGHLPGPLTAQRCGELTTCVRQAYTDISRQHNPAVGNDAITYGIAVSRAVWFRLEQRYARSHAVRIERPDNSFELVISGLRLRPFKLGDSAGDNVWSSMPWNVQATTRMATLNVSQLQLGIAAPSNYVLGHFGSPGVGFAMLYLCSPILDRQGRVVQWASAIRIDNLGGATQPVRRPQPQPLGRPPIRVLPAAPSSQELSPES